MVMLGIHGWLLNIELYGLSLQIYGYTIIVILVFHSCNYHSQLCGLYDSCRSYANDKWATNGWLEYVSHLCEMLSCFSYVSYILDHEQVCRYSHIKAYTIDLLHLDWEFLTIEFHLDGYFFLITIFLSSIEV